jgi:hypothetical protein
MRFVGIDMKIMLMESFWNILNYFHETFSYGRGKNIWTTGNPRTIQQRIIIFYYTISRKLTMKIFFNTNNMEEVVESIRFQQPMNHCRWTKVLWLPLWSSGQNSWLQIQRFRVCFTTLPDFLRSIRSGTGPTRPHEDNGRGIWIENYRLRV